MAAFIRQPFLLYQQHKKLSSIKAYFYIKDAWNLMPQHLKNISDNLRPSSTYKKWFTGL